MQRRCRGERIRRIPARKRKNKKLMELAVMVREEIEGR